MQNFNPMHIGNNIFGSGQKPSVPAVIRKREGRFLAYQIQCATQFLLCAGGILKIGVYLFLLLEVCPAVASSPARHSQNSALIEGVTRACRGAGLLASGYRANGSGALTNVGSNGNYWTFAPNSQTNARNLNFNSGNINPLNNNNRSNGFSVRPSRAFDKKNIPTRPDVHFLNMVYTYEQIHKFVTIAYLKAREHERGTVAQLAFEMNLEREIASLAWELYKRTWFPGPLDWFVLTYPSVREVFAPQFRDRVVSHVLVLLTEGIFERYFIYDSHSCRKGKGTLNGITRFEHHIRSVTNNYTRDGYCLNIDISGYFMSIDRAILYDIAWGYLEKYRANNPDAVDYDFIDYIICTFLWRDPLEGCVYHGDPHLQKLVMPGKSLRFQKPGIGLPIGDVRNQQNSNIYLTPFDHFCLRVILAMGYDRYVDDARVLHTSFQYLVECKERCGDFLADRLHLQLHPNKTTITDLHETNYFLGGAVSPYRRYAVSGTLSRFRAFMVDAEAQVKAGVPIDWMALVGSLNSRLGYLQHFRETKSTAKILSLAPNVCRELNISKDYTKASLKTISNEQVSFFRAA